MVTVTPASTPATLDAVRVLMRAFVAWQRERNADDIDLVDRYFDARAFEDELASLPGKYAPPAGRLLLADCDGEHAGCVALRPIDAQSCEMKRMFVDRRFQGRGVGKALAQRVIAEAREAGYRTVLLDTSWRQTEAQRLYESLGFERIEPYYEVPDDLRTWLVFYSMNLQPPGV